MKVIHVLALTALAIALALMGCCPRKQIRDDGFHDGTFTAFQKTQRWLDQEKRGQLSTDDVRRLVASSLDAEFIWSLYRMGAGR